MSIKKNFETYFIIIKNEKDINPSYDHNNIYNVEASTNAN